MHAWRAKESLIAAGAPFHSLPRIVELSSTMLFEFMCSHFFVRPLSGFFIACLHYASVILLCEYFT